MRAYWKVQGIAAPAKVAAYATAVLLVLVLAAVPYWGAIVPPMTDVAQHVLVTYVVREYDNPLLRYREYLEFGWTGAPTDLFYLSFSLLQSVSGPIVDAKVYLTLWAASLWASVTWLARAFHRENAWLSGLLAMPLAFSWYVYMGFLPFLLSLPVFAVTLGIWFRPMHVHWKVPICWILLICLFGFHVVGAAAASAVIAISAAIDSAQPREGRARLQPLLLAVVVLLPVPVLLFRYVFGANAPTVTTSQFDLVRNVKDVLHYTAASVARPTMYVMLVWIGVVALAAVVAFFRRRLPPATWVPATFFGFLSVLMPSSLGALWPAGPRLLPFLLILLAAGLHVPMRRRAITTAALCGLVAVLSVLTISKVRTLDTDLRAFLAADEFIPQGAKVLPILTNPAEGSRDVSPFWSLASVYTIRRGGAHPYIFARPYILTGASPLRYRDRSTFPYAFLLDSGKAADDYRGVSCCYDAVMVWGRDPALDSVLMSELHLAHERGKLRVFLRAKPGA